MTSTQPPNPPPIRDEEKVSASTSEASTTQQAEADKMDITPDPPAETWSDLPEELLTASPEEIVSRRRLIENDIRVMRSETLRLQHEQDTMREKIRENGDKIKQNKVLPYLVSNVV
ncbi:26S proteasome regulatory subunit 6A, partial [Serendipita sp. 400]